MVVLLKNYKICFISQSVPFFYIYVFITAMGNVSIMKKRRQCEDRCSKQNSNYEITKTMYHYICLLSFPLQHFHLITPNHTVVERKGERAKGKEQHSPSEPRRKGRWGKWGNKWGTLVSWGKGKSNKSIMGENRERVKSGKRRRWLNVFIKFLVIYPVWKKSSEVHTSKKHHSCAGFFLDLPEEPSVEEVCWSLERVWMEVGLSSLWSAPM